MDTIFLQHRIMEMSNFRPSCSTSLSRSSTVNHDVPSNSQIQKQHNKGLKEGVAKQITKRVANGKNKNGEIRKTKDRGNLHIEVE